MKRHCDQGNLEKDLLRLTVSEGEAVSIVSGTAGVGKKAWWERSS